MPTTRRRSYSPVKTPSRPKSPSKAKKSPSRTKSPSKAKKSPVRSRSRSRSAARKPAARSRSRSRGRPASKAVTESVVEVVQQSKSQTRVTRSPARPITPPRTVQKKALEPEIVPTRVSRRIQEKNSFEVTKGTSVSARGDVRPSRTVTSSSSTAPSGTGPGVMGGFLVLAVIGLTFYLSLACTKKSCSLFKIPSCPANLKAFLNIEVMQLVVGFYAAMFALAAIPLGSVVQVPLSDGRKLSYRCNGWLTLFVVASLFGWAVQRGCPMDYVDVHYLQFVTSGVILSLVTSVLVFIWKRNCPAKDRCPGSDGTFLNDFWMGRVLNPRCETLNVDLKQLGMRCGLVIWLLIDWMYLVERFKSTQTVEPALAFVVLCHTIYILFSVRNEHTWFTSNDFGVEGYGYMTCWVTMCFMPYMFPMAARFLYMYPKEAVINHYALAAFFIFNVAGLVFFIGSNWQKNEFRKNPYNPELSHLASIPTASGKRILCSGWWGIVRRPNYLGDLMMAVAWSLPCGCSYALPYFYPAYLLVLLIGRCINDEESCKQRYGDAWDKYTSIVKYRLIPGIF